MLIEGFISMEDSGIPTFAVKHPDAKWDEVLLSGFLSSINDFFKQALDSGYLSNIQFQEKQVFFSFSSRLKIKFALIANKLIPNNIAEYCLNELQEQYMTFFIEGKKMKAITESQSEDFSKNIAYPTIEKWETKAMDLRDSLE